MCKCAPTVCADRVYVDVQLNHMTGTERSGTGTAGSKFNGGTLDFPGVPYTSANFNPRSKCPSSDGHIDNYDNAAEVRNCQLLTLADLDQVRMTSVMEAGSCLATLPVN